MSLPSETALVLINDRLGIEGVRTNKGDEVKCWVHDYEAGARVKTYLDAKDCYELAEAFGALGDGLGSQ